MVRAVLRNRGLKEAKCGCKNLQEPDKTQQNLEHYLRHFAGTADRYLPDVLDFYDRHKQALDGELASAMEPGSTMSVRNHLKKYLGAEGPSPAVISLLGRLSGCKILIITRDPHPNWTNFTEKDPEIMSVDAVFMHTGLRQFMPVESTTYRPQIQKTLGAGPKFFLMSQVVNTQVHRMLQNLLQADDEVQVVGAVAGRQQGRGTPPVPMPGPSTETVTRTRGRRTATATASVAPDAQAQPIVIEPRPTVTSPRPDTESPEVTIARLTGENNILRRDIRKIAEGYDVMEKKLEEALVNHGHVEMRLMKVENERKAFEQELQKKIDALKQQSGEAEDREKHLSDTVEAMAGGQQALEEQCKRAQDEATACREEAEKAEKILQDAKEELTSMTEERDRQQAQLALMHDTVLTSENAKKDAEKEVQRLKDKMTSTDERDQLEKEKKAVEKERDEALKKAADLEKKLAQTTATLEQVETETVNARLEQERDAAVNERDKRIDELADTKKDLEKNEKERKALKKDVKNLTTQVNDLNMNNAVMMDELVQTRAQAERVNGLEERIRNLEAERDALQNQLGQQPPQGAGHGVQPQPGGSTKRKTPPPSPPQDEPVTDDDEDEPEVKLTPKKKKPKYTMFACTLCDYVGKDKDLAEHLEKKHSKTHYVCGEHHMVWDPEDADAYGRHMRRHRAHISCPKCDRNFAQQSELQDHVASFHESKKFICGTCGKPCSRERDLRRHQSSVHGPAIHYICLKCGDLKLKNKRSYLEHHRKYHKGSQDYKKQDDQGNDIPKTP